MTKDDIDALAVVDQRSGTYGRPYHTAKIDLALEELATEITKWLDRDREDDMMHYHIASRITNIARALSAETHALAKLTEVGK